MNEWKMWKMWKMWKEWKEWKEWQVWIIFIILCVILFFVEGQVNAWAQESESIAAGEITVKGACLEIDPAQQSVPINTETAINTVFPVDSVDNAEILQGMLVKGTLRGPGINGSITLTTLPNHPFAIPGFPLNHSSCCF